MSKTQTSILKNRTFGHIVAILFFIVLGYGLFLSATKMNYTWKWHSIPQYFLYEKVDDFTAPFDGIISISSGVVKIVSQDEQTHEFNLDTNAKIFVEDGQFVYEYDEVASSKQWRAGPLVEGLLVTIKISIVSAIIAFAIGILVAFMRLSSYQFLNDISAVYITIIRGTPLLVQIFIFYFVIATIFEIDRFLAGALSLGIFFGAYIAEVLRGAIQSIDIGQQEAAKSLGFNYLQTMRLIIIPQALKRALPTLVGEMISLVKDSSLVSVIAITDLTRVGREIVSNTFSPFETWIVIAGMYLCLTAILSYLGHKLENKMKKEGGM